MRVTNKTRCLMTSHKIISYAEDFKRRSEQLQMRKSKTKDKSEAMLIDCELEVLNGLFEKLGEMMEEIEGKLDIK